MIGDRPVEFNDVASTEPAVVRTARETMPAPALLDAHMAADPIADLETFAQHFRECGGTDEHYLRAHFPRYVATRTRLLSSNTAIAGKMLDVGAHWLHQSLLYALSGFSVTALDTPTTFADEHVMALADRYGITLLHEPNLTDPKSLRDLPDDFFDVVLFTEIIEHLAFNPVALWTQLYRMLKPGGRVIITTPNYYALRGRAWQWPRFLRGAGAGVQVAALLRQQTFAHHWKEYSLAELREYFSVLSADFRVARAFRVGKYGESQRQYLLDRAVRLVEFCIPPLRPELYLEIELAQKSAGISVVPGW